MPHRLKPLPVRLYLGIHNHFPARRSEWVLAGIMVAWGWLLIAPSSAFEGSRAWSQMAAILSEAAWGWLAISVGLFRLLALVINGTFATTCYGRWSAACSGAGELPDVLHLVSDFVRPLGLGRGDDWPCCVSRPACARRDEHRRGDQGCCGHG